MTNKKQSRCGYSLKHKSKDGTISTFKIKTVNGVTRARFYLTDIDAITTKFDNFESFKKIMITLIPTWDGTTYWIEYSQNNRFIKLPLVFKDQKLLTKLANENKGKEELKKEPWLNAYLKEFIIMVCEEKEKIKYLKQYKYIGPRLNTLLDEFENSKDVTKKMKAIEKIKNLLANYYIIRRLEIGKAAYNRKLEKYGTIDGNGEISKQKVMKKH